MDVQLDLFGEVEATAAAAAAAGVERRRTGLLVLRDYCALGLEVTIGAWRPERTQIKTNLVHPWAYSIRKSGFLFEHEDTWGGWYERPKYLLTWTEFDDMLRDDPRVAEVLVWSRSLEHPDAWLDRMRPHELYPYPERDQWHPSYIEGDHERPGWADRLHAWMTVRAILTDAAEAL